MAKQCEKLVIFSLKETLNKETNGEICQIVFKVDFE